MRKNVKINSVFIIDLFPSLRIKGINSNKYVIK